MCVCTCVCVTYNQLQISGSRLKWLQLFIKRSCMQRVSSWDGGRWREVDHLSKQSLRSYQCSTLASLGFHLHRKERQPFISFLPQLTRSFLCVIVIVRNIIMDNQSINNIMRQSPLLLSGLGSINASHCATAAAAAVVQMKRGLRLVWHLQM